MYDSLLFCLGPMPARMYLPKRSTYAERFPVPCGFSYWRVSADGSRVAAEKHGDGHR